MVRAKDEDPETQKMRQELTRAKTPNQLGNISSISDIPVPSPIQNLFSKKKYADFSHTLTFNFSYLTLFP